jgi:hypothetical protein
MIDKLPGLNNPLPDRLDGWKEVFILLPLRLLLLSIASTFILWVLIIIGEVMK